MKRNPDGLPVYIPGLEDTYHRWLRSVEETKEHFYVLRDMKPEEFLPTTDRDIQILFDRHFARYQQIALMLKYLGMQDDPAAWTLTMITYPYKTAHLLHEELLTPVVTHLPYQDPLLGVRLDEVNFLVPPKGGVEVCSYASFPVTNMPEGLSKCMLIEDDGEDWTEPLLLMHDHEEVDIYFGSAMIESLLSEINPPEMN